DGYRCIRMEDFGARDETPEEYCRTMVTECDIFVGIVGHRFGSCPLGKDRSFTQLEYDAAKSLRKPTLMFVASAKVSIPPEVTESPEQAAAQKRFRNEVLADQVAVVEFDSPDALATRVLEAIQNQRRSPEAASVLRAHRDDCLRTHSRVAVLGDHPAEALDTFPQVPYIARRFDTKARGQIEGPPQRLAPEKVARAVRLDERPPQQDERFLLERLGVVGTWILVEGEG